MAEEIAALPKGAAIFGWRGECAGVSGARCGSVGGAASFQIFSWLKISFKIERKRDGSLRNHVMINSMSTV
jgi:hypothetical protein